MTDIPPPLVPTECDLTGFEFMPLEIVRLKKSKAWLRAKRIPFLAFYLLNMWMRAFIETPAGSIENDEDVLAAAADCPPDQWENVREEVMRGWILCSDGRWHHPVVAEKVLSGWADRLIHLHGKYSQRVRKAAQRSREDNRPEIEPAKPLLEWLESSYPQSFCIAKNLFPQEFELMSQGQMANVTGTDAVVPVTPPQCHRENALKGEGEGEGEGEIREEGAPVAGAPPPPPPSGLFEEFIREYRPLKRQSDDDARAPFEKLAADEQIHMPAIARAHNAFLDEEARHQRHKPQKINPKDFIRKGIHRKYLKDIIGNAEAEQKRKRELETTIESWNGKAQSMIAKIGAQKFQSLFVPSTLVITDTDATLLCYVNFKHNQIQGDPGMCERLDAVVGKSVKIKLQKIDGP